MDTFVSGVAVGMLIINAITVVGGPWMIGRPKMPTHYTAAWYLTTTLGAGLSSLLAGRVLGWW